MVTRSAQHTLFVKGPLANAHSDPVRFNLWKRTTRCKYRHKVTPAYSLTRHRVVESTLTSLDVVMGVISKVSLKSRIMSWNFKFG